MVVFPSLSWPSLTLSLSVRDNSPRWWGVSAGWKSVPSQMPRDVLESSGSIVWDHKPACRSLTCPWPSASKINPFLPLLFIKPDGLMKAIHSDVSFLPNVLKNQGFLSSFFWQNTLAWYSRVKSYSLFPAPSLSLPPIQRLGSQRKVISLSLSLRESTQWSCIEFLLQHFFSWLYFRPITWG